MKKAFSLVELLISLIIISVIAAAFAPMVSQKINNGKIGVSANKVKTDCPTDPYGANCEICDMNKCLLRFCKNTCAGSQYRDANCICHDCATKYGEKCIACNETRCLKEEKDIACPEGCEECDESGRCIKCIEGTRLKNNICVLPRKPISQEDCDKATNYNSIFIPYDLNNINAGGFCVHRKNAGDYGGPSTNSPFISTTGVSSKAADACKSDFCCYVGGEGRYDIQQGCSVKTESNSSGSCGCSAVNNATNKVCTATDNCTKRNSVDELTHVAGTGESDYGACFRTVCNWDAAAYICQRYSVGLTDGGDWDLPNSTQLSAIKAAIEAGPANKDSTTHTIAIQKFSGSNGLQLCAHGGSPSKTGSPKCNSRDNYCLKNDIKSAARPSYIWGSMGEDSNCSTVCISGGKCELTCSGKICTRWSGKCNYNCDTQPESSSTFWKSPYKSYYNKTCGTACPANYPYKWGNEKICATWEESSGNVSVMYLTGDNTNKTTTVTIDNAYAHATAKSNTASVRCVLNRYVE